VPDFQKKNGKMNCRTITLIVWLLSNTLAITLEAQNTWSVVVSRRVADSLIELHSFSYGRLNDTLIIFGGRNDGIHGKEKGFEKQGRNDHLIIYDIKLNKSSSIDLNTFSDSLKYPLTASASEFIQEGKILYLMGGYGQNAQGLYETYPSLTRIDLEQLIRRIKDKMPLAPAFSQSVNDSFAIAGGQMKKSGDQIYLVGGHRFDGRYSQDSKNYRQTYTERVYIFRFTERDSLPAWNIENVLTDELNFHRRDFNLAPFVTSAGIIEPVAFAGVFMMNDARPFRNISSIQVNGFTDIRDFNQNLANYQCAHFGLYSSSQDLMQEFFLGGMAEYYLNPQGELVRDPLVPFVKTISCVQRDKSGQYSEFALRDTMPLFMGSNSEFIPSSRIPFFNDEIIDADRLLEDTIHLGWVIGGIVNPASRLHPWQDSLPETTIANPWISDIFLIRQYINSVHDKKIILPGTSVTCNPNPCRHFCNIALGQEVESISIWLLDNSGRLHAFQKFRNGNSFSLDTRTIPAGNYRLSYLVNGSQYGSFLLQIGE